MSGLCAAVLLARAAPAPGAERDLFLYHGDSVPAEVEAMYLKGLDYLMRTQTREGCWQDSQGMAPGVVGLAVLAMLAHGDDPNFGPTAPAIKRGLNFILKSARRDNGYIGSSMYNHGFATLALAEAYGAVDDDRLGPALKKAVELIITAQAVNSQGAWRYSPDTTSADTTVSGAQMVALVAARNAGIAVPDKVIQTGLDFFRRCQGGDGGMGYTSAGGSNLPRTAIGTLVFALARQKETREFKAAFRYLQQAQGQDEGYVFYCLYYAAQAYFHADKKAWDVWNAANIKKLAEMQNSDGSWVGNNGPSFSTSAALLSLAVNYRFLPIYER